MVKVYVEIVVLSAMTVIGILGNILVIGALVIQKETRQKVGNMLVINLAVADLLVVTILIPTILMNVSAGEIKTTEGTALCEIVSFFSVFSSGMSIYSIMTIAVNRYINVCKGEITYKRIFSKSKMAAMLGVLYVYMIICSLLGPIFGYSTSRYMSAMGTCTVSSRYKIFYILVGFQGFVLPATVTCICYARVFMKIRSTRHVQTSSTINRKQKAVRTLFLVFLLFVGCWLPHAVTMVIDPQRRLPTEFLRFTSWLSLANSCINSFVYGLRCQQFRKGYKKVLCFWKRYQRVVPAAIPQGGIFHIS